MPEGHTIHRLARELAQLEGEHVRASSPQGRFGSGAAEIDGAVLERAEAYGKHLFVTMSSGATVHVHLGMHGKLLRFDDPSGRPMKQVRLRLATDRVAWDLVAPSVCELLDDAGVQRIWHKLGPDPLRPDADAARVDASLASDARMIGVVLLDQAVLAGVGNVFRNEALHAVGVAPTRPSRDLSDGVRAQLWRVLRQMMARAVEDGRIITVEAADRLAVPEAEARRVYKQEHCRDCGAPVVVSSVGGRTAYHCPREQPA